MKKELSWNSVLNFVVEIKQRYYQYFDDDIFNLKVWINKLNISKYLDFAEKVTINQHGDLVLIKYSMVDVKEMWIDPNSIYRECRSVVIDIRNEELVLTPFRKFFNLDEVHENSFEIISEKIKTAKSIEISNKLDGSMQSARYYKGNIIMSGSNALDFNNSWRLTDGYSKLTDNYKAMIIDNSNYTFIFEYITLKNAIVVQYKPEDEGLYLIGMRNVLNGKELSYSEIKHYADVYGVPMTEIEEKTFEQILEEAKNAKSNEKEGWVLNINGNHKIKLKCNDYVQIHRMLGKISSINVIIENIADGTYDDLYSKIPIEYRSRVEKVATFLFDYTKNKSAELKKYYDLAPKENKKDFMIWVDNNCPIDLKGYVRAKYLGKKINFLKSGSDKTPNYKKASELGLDLKYSVLFEES